MNNDLKTGVVLAAGFGSRLAGVSAETALKPLTSVAGRPLLLRTLDSLALAGCERVVIVLGYGAGDVQAEIEAMYDGGLDLIFAYNPLFERKNGLSVLAARPHVPGPFILSMADHVFGDEVMRLARSHHPPPRGATLLVEYKLASIFDIDDATKVLAEADQIVDIGKHIPHYNCVDTGLFVCTPGLMDALEATYQAHGDASLSDGIAHLARQGRMRVLDIGDGFWQDVDTPAMLRHANAILTRRGG